MNRTKGYALMFLLGAFIAGGALGFSADRAIRGGHGPARGPRAYRQRMAEELKLTPQQQASVDSLIEQKHRQIMALYKPLKSQLDSRSEEHTSELQSLMRSSYAVFCLKKKKF